MKYWLLFLIFPFIVNAQKKGAEVLSPANIVYKKLNDRSPRILLIGSKEQLAYASFHSSENAVNVTSIKFIAQNLNYYKAPVYFCVYENKDGKPGEILQKLKIPVNIKKGLYEITLHFSEPVKLNSSGLFLGFEWVLDNKNRLKETDVYQPEIVRSTTQDLKSNLWVYDGKEWKKEPDDDIFPQIYFEFNFLK